MEASGAPGHCSMLPTPGVRGGVPPTWAPPGRCPGQKAAELWAHATPGYSKDGQWGERSKSEPWMPEGRSEARPGLASLPRRGQTRKSEHPAQDGGWLSQGLRAGFLRQDWDPLPSMHTQGITSSGLCPCLVLPTPSSWRWRGWSPSHVTGSLGLLRESCSPEPSSVSAMGVRGGILEASRGRRLTAQRSVEDKGEAAPEQCQRERVGQLQAQDEDGGGHAPEQAEPETLLSLKASEVPELDEDEGFGDWSQRPEQQQREGAQGTPDGGEPPRCRSPEGEQEDRPGPHACGKGDSDEGHLEELSLSKEGPDPEDTVQDNRGAAGAEEEQEHRKCQQPRTPSPLVLEGTPEHSSPPLSPTTKLIDRTESLNRSIEKSNSVKKSQPDLPISRIDQRLEQYTQAIETSGRTPKLARQASIELPSMAVASTKSLWETGEVQAQSAAKTPSCKDIVAGDMSKKSLWEQKGGSKTSSTIKSTPSGKRYKFVATGHGKYEKVLVEGGPAP
ncbi:lymphocyte-specific protein 1 isoform X1 [Saimiri boliviensis]|uniref:lymphocyte-specific protein 1 isoform X1 n=1 Tax=Saimiri boliviensis TaxID=27679 RepID=UPI00193D9D05|nr:lymphocyte-specific protein 1 isoform X1 [Saimiri boliviensis boliviensis]